MDPQAVDYAAQGAAAGMGIGMMLVWLAFVIVSIIAGWVILAKAGKPGWGILIPIWNAILMLQVAGKPAWWIILFFIPVVNLIVSILVALGLAKNFGKGPGFAVGLILLGPIFYLILAFGDAKYVGDTQAAA